ncbi:MAG: single-stranded DNA-binding protein [Actinomycetota bacterium]|nr:single-stranded DNA-binding protein [Actinomycetota bacterium]
MAGNINRVIITGNLTKDPDLSSVPSTGNSVCTLRVACNGRRKNSESGAWEDQPNFFDVTVWGAQGENCSRYLSKGRPVAVDGRLRWREWQTPEGQKRQAVDIIAESVQFLGGRDDAGNGNGNGNGFSSSVRAAESDVPIDTGDFEPAPVATAAAEDDIPF